MKKRVLTFILTFTALITAVFGVTACSSVEFKVNFMVDGAVYATVQTNGSEIIKMPENPTKEDHVFDGWYWDEGIWERPFTANSLLDAPLSSDMSVYCKWKANAPSVENVTLDNTELVMYKNDVANLTATITPSEAKQDVVWSSSNTSVATVQNGTVTAVSVGTATITVTTVDGNKTATCNVEVLEDCITFKTLTVEDETVYGKVSNETETFSFIKEVEAYGSATYQVYKELTCETLIPSKSISLNVGDNTVYILQSIGNDLKLYTVTVRRRPMYEVTFNTNGGTEVESQIVEEDSLATEPVDVGTKEGHSFDGWNYDFSKPITQNTNLIAEWTPNKYTLTIVYNNGQEDLVLTKDYGAEIIGVVTPEKTGYSFAGWDNNIPSKMPAKNLTVEAVWRINEYTLTFCLNNGQDDLEIKQNYNTEIPEIATPSKIGYIFTGWSMEIPQKMPAGNLEIIALYSIKPEMQNFLFVSTATTCEIGGIRNANITELVIPDCTTSIAKEAFYNCTSLTSVTMPNSVTSIGYAAFRGCTSLTSVVIGDGVTSIGYEAFKNCSSLTSITLPFVGASLNGTSYMHFGYIFGASHSSYNDDYVPTSLKEVIITGSANIGYEAFKNCSSLTSITLPFVGATKDGTSETHFGYIFGASSYSYNDDYVPTSLKEVIITGGASIGNYAFRNCDSLTSVVIGDGVTSIGDGTFYNCKSLTSVVIGDGVTSIGSDAFYWCDSLTSVVIGDSVTSIGSNAFSGCNSLTSVTIGNSVTSIGEYAFFGCYSLTSITVGENNANYKSIDGSLYSKDGETLLQYAIAKTDANFTIPDGVTSIGGAAFAYCSSLTSVEIPNSVISIGSSAFYLCTSLTSVVIPNSVISIGSSAFYNCSSLTSVVIGDNVTSISNSAFYNCTSLTSVVIGDSVTSIGREAFYNCDSLTSIEIPDSVTSIGNGAFYSCNSLITVTIGNGVTSIGYEAFKNCSSLTSITLPFVGASLNGTSNKHFGYIFGASSYSVNDDYVPTSLKEVIITGSANIGNYAFYYCTSLTSVVIGDGVTSIGGAAFAYCTSLTSVVIGDGVTSIGSSAFHYCKSLASITLPFVGASLNDTSNMHFGYIFGASSYLYNEHYVPTSLKEVIITGGESIGNLAFYYCTSLTNITIPDSVTSIGENAFYGCNSALYTTENNLKYVKANGNNYCILIEATNKNLSTYQINENTKYIAHSAFFTCESLTNITIPNSVTSIGSSAFNGCYRLVEVVNKSTHIIVEKGSSSNGYVGRYALAVYNSDSGITESQLVNDNGYIIYTNENEKILVGYNGQATDLVLPNYITKINNYAFYLCTSITSVEIPDSVTSIGEYAFAWCNSLTSIEIPDSVTSIDSYAFRDCFNLTIYCEAVEKSAGWSYNWNYSSCPVVWGYNANA